MSPIILLVDDNADFARRASDLVFTRTGLRCEHASSAREAQTIVEREEVAVVILDQRMPDLPGTELLGRLRLVRPALRSIMLTGEADASEVGAGLRIGFSDYLHKSRISELAERAAMQYLQYLTTQADRLVHGEPILVWPRSRWGRLRTRAQVLLTSVSVLDPGLIDVDGWVTVLQLQLGEQNTTTKQLARSVSLEMESESQRAFQAALHFNPRIWHATQESILESSRTHIERRKRATEESVSTSTEQSFTLPAPEDPGSGNFVRSRHFQQARVRRKLLATYRLRCRCCDIGTTVPVILFQDSERVATRHQDYRNDGTVVTVETGLVTLPN